MRVAQRLLLRECGFPFIKALLGLDLIQVWELNGGEVASLSIVLN